MKKFIFAVVAISVTSLTGCSIPQTRAEYKSNSYTKQQSFSVARKLDVVVASLNKQAQACVNSLNSQTRSGVGSISTSTSMNMMTTTKTSANRAELTYRQKDNTMIGVPEDGLFLFVADLNAQGADSTKVTFYSYGTSDSLVNAVREWAKGNDNSCHGYGGK